MRDLVDIGKNDKLYVDSDQVLVILPDEKKTFGSIVVVVGVSHPIATSLSPQDVLSRLQGV